VERSAKNRARKDPRSSHTRTKSIVLEEIQHNLLSCRSLIRMWISALISGITREISSGRQLDISSISFWVVIIQYAIVFIRLSTWRALCQSRYRKLFALIVISAARRYVWRNPYYPEAQWKLRDFYVKCTAA